MRGHYGQIDEETLVLWATVGDLEAFDELARRFRPAVTLVARQEIGSRDAAEDVAQDALLLAFRALPQLKEAAKFPSWLGAIARHRARRIAAGEGRQQPVERNELDQLVLAQSAALCPHPAEEVLRRAEHTALSLQVDALPAELRTVLHLFYFEEWPVKRIADFLSLPVTTVKWRLHEGRNRMRRSLVGSGGEE